MSRVDVIIPCYRYAHFLEACVTGVLDQPGVEVRVLILDDESPDDTPQVGQRLARADSRVEYRRHAVNKGHLATYNEGLEWASGDYALLLSADDLVTPGALGRAAALMDAHPEVGLCYGRQIVFQSDQPLPAVPDPQDEGCRVISGAEFIEEGCRTATNNVPTPSAVVRVALQKELGGYRADLPHSGDMEMWFRFAAHASVGVLNAYQAYYRLHGGNMRYQYLGEGDLRQRKDAFEILFRERGHRLAERERLEALARRSLAEFAFWEASRAFDRGDGRACRQILAFAVEVDPAVRDSRSWSRLRLKRVLGSKLWSLLRPTVDRLRGAPV